MTLSYSKKYVLVPYEQFERWSMKGNVNDVQHNSPNTGERHGSQSTKDTNQDKIQSDSTDLQFKGEDEKRWPPLPLPPNKALQPILSDVKASRFSTRKHYTTKSKRPFNGWHML